MKATHIMGLALVAACGGTPTRAAIQGVAFTFRSVPGMTKEWMTKVVQCHLARSDAMGHQMPARARERRCNSEGNARRRRGRGVLRRSGIHRRDHPAWRDAPANADAYRATEVNARA